MFDASPRHLKSKGFSFMDMLTSGAEAHNLPQAVQTFTAALSLSIKEEYNIKASIHGVSHQFDVLEKQLHQAVKGVKYESGSRKEDGNHLQQSNT